MIEDEIRPYMDRYPMRKVSVLEVNSKQLENTFRRYLPDFNQTAVREMLEIVGRHSIQIVHEPESGLIMMNVIDCFDTPFHLGEVLVTTAEVEYKGIVGHATIMGQEPKKAVLAAAVNAILQKDNESTLRDLWPLVAKHGQTIDKKREQESKLVASTRVAFENMAKEA
jgi:phosphonate C-P lyase system protein PhnG